MGNNDVNNDFLKKLQDTVFNNSWMNGVYGSQRSEQQEKLKKVFSVISDNNVTAAEKKHLEAQIETIQEKVERLEAKMAVLEEELAKNSDEIAKQAKKITDLVTDANNASDVLEEKQSDYVQLCIEDVFYQLENGIIEKDEVVPEIRKRLKDDYILQKYGAKVESILGQLDSKEAEVANLVTQADKWINQKKILEAQYGATKTTYDLLNATVTKIGATETNYTNSDFNNSTPVYSPEKANVVEDIANKYTTQAGANSNYVAGTSAPSLESLDAITDKYKDLLGAKQTGEAYSSSNQAVKNLGKALNMNGDGTGLIEDLAKAGLSAGQVADFIAQNFAGAQIKKNGNNLSIPYGHDDAGTKIYNTLNNKIKNFNACTDGFLGALNTWDENGGNTISSNNQIKTLSENYDSVITELANSGFTFKEAMYALFDSEKGIFKDSGVSYNLKAQGETPNYFIEYAGDQETADMYQGLSDKIFDTWGVRPSRGISSDEYDEAQTPEEVPSTPDDDPTTEAPITSRTDPVWFSLDGDKNHKYSFVIDRDGDGTFSDASEFVGGSNSTWLEDLRSLDTDGDGKLTGDELKALKLFGTDFTDGAAVVEDSNVYDPYKNASNNKYDRETTTNVAYTMQSAASMGITEIDLNNLDEQVNNSQGTYDVNGSEKFSDSFTFKMGDKEITAHRQDETDDYMNAIYGDAYGKSFEIGFNEPDVQEVMDKDYGEFDKFSEKYAEVFGNINILKNAGNIAQEARAMYDDTLERIEDSQNAELIKAGNKAAATKEVASWNTLKGEVQQIAQREGIAIDMEQAKGIYVLDGSLSAQGVVDRYKEQVKQEQDIADAQAIRQEAWKAIVVCAKAGIAASAAEIKALLQSGEAKTAQEVADLLSAKLPQGVDVELVTRELGFDSDREKEIYDSFNSTFEEAGLGDKVVDALYDLCVEQQDNPEYMSNKSGTDLAKELLKKYQ